MNGTVRTFLALHIPDSVRKDLREFEARLQRFDADVKWVRPEALHITLKFLGDVESGRIPEVGDAVDRAVSGKRAFDLSLEGTGCFPNLKRPAVLWIGVKEGAKEATDLASAAESALLELGFEREKRPFSPHLTMGRIRSPRNVTQMMKAAAEAGFASAPFRIDSVHLMKSDLQYTGAVYTSLRSLKLQG